MRQNQLASEGRIREEKGHWHEIVEFLISKGNFTH